MDDEAVVELASVISDLAQGPGATPERCKEALADFKLDLIGIIERFRGSINEMSKKITDDERLDYPSSQILEYPEYYLLERASRLITDDRHRLAVRNALALTGSDEAHSLTLTRRRNLLLQSEYANLRTLIRHEREGADALARIALTLDRTRTFPYDLESVLTASLNTIRLKFDLEVAKLKQDTEWQPEDMKKAAVVLLNYLVNALGSRVDTAESIDDLVDNPEGLHAALTILFGPDEKLPESLRRRRD